jgi:hypothetical protein
MVEGTATIRWRIPRTRGHLEVRGTLLPSFIRPAALTAERALEPASDDIVRVVPRMRPEGQR